MSIKTDYLRMKKNALTSTVGSAASGFLNVFAVGNKVYFKDESGDLINPYTPVARTATADGTTTGTIAEPNTVIQPTSANAAHWFILPTMAVGDTVVFLPDVGATGYEIRTWDVANVEFNNVAGTAGLELAVAADTTIVVLCVATNSIIAWKFSNAGAPAGGGTPDV